MLTGVSLTPKQDSAFTKTVNQTFASFPAAKGLLTNVIIVGNNKLDGSANSTSSRGPDVRCVGELVYSTCGPADPGLPSFLAMGCKGNDGWYTGTSQAAPQVAGLAAYLWTLKPSLNVSQLRDIILTADINNQVDGYSAVMGLDNGLTSASMRLKLLDIADASDAEFPDGQFTQHDITLFLQKFHEFEQLRGDPPFLSDYSRYDLNGDGLTGDSTIQGALFDLDVNVPQSFGTASQIIQDSTRLFDETSLGDYDLLCYYGYSELYTGDIDLLHALLPCGVAEPDTTQDSTEIDLTGAYLGTSGGLVNMHVTQTGDVVSGSLEIRSFSSQHNGTFSGTISGTQIVNISLQLDGCAITPSAPMSGGFSVVDNRTTIAIFTTGFTDCHGHSFGTIQACGPNSELQTVDFSGTYSAVFGFEGQLFSATATVTGGFGGISGTFTGQRSGSFSANMILPPQGVGCIIAQLTDIQITFTGCGIAGGSLPFEGGCVAYSLGRITLDLSTNKGWRDCNGKLFTGFSFAKSTDLCTGN